MSSNCQLPDKPSSCFVSISRNACRTAVPFKLHGSILRTSRDSVGVAMNVYSRFCGFSFYGIIVISTTTCFRRATIQRPSQNPSFGTCVSHLPEHSYRVRISRFWHTKHPFGRPCLDRIYVTRPSNEAQSWLTVSSTKFWSISA